METAFTRLVGCAVPLQQAGMGGTATPALAAAVANAGGLGMLGTPMAGLPGLDRDLTEVDRLTGGGAGAPPGSVGINFIMPFLDRNAVEAAAGRVRVVEFFYGDPDPALVELAHSGGALVSWQVGSSDEAAAAAGAGCDLVVAQGVEAGGHVRGNVALTALLGEVLEAADVPVLAAGGIGSAADVAAVLAAGAAGARVGTRFVAAAEADAHPDYVDALIAASADDTVLTTTFSVMWPDAPHRVLRDCITAAEQSTADVVGQLQLGGISLPVPRGSVLAPDRSTTGHIAAMAQYAGRSVGQVRGRMPAAEIVRELTAGAEGASAR